MYAVAAPEHSTPSVAAPRQRTSTGRPAGVVRRPAPRQEPGARHRHVPSTPHYGRRRLGVGLGVVAALVILVAAPLAPSVSERLAGLTMLAFWVISVVGLLRWSRPTRERTAAAQRESAQQSSGFGSLA